MIIQATKRNAGWLLDRFVLCTLFGSTLWVWFIYEGNLTVVLCDDGVEKFLSLTLMSQNFNLISAKMSRFHCNKISDSVVYPV